MTHSTGRTALFSALGLTAALALASCASTPGEETAPAPEPAVSDSAPAPAATETTAPDQTQGSEDASWMDAVAAAIELAESEAGGTAYEIDDEDDDGSWEIQVAVGGEEWEVHVSADGASVLSSERDGDVDSDDRAALDAAGITLIDAIEAAATEHAGAELDDVDLDDHDDGTFSWEVSFQDDVDVYVAVTDGSIIRVDR